ncbi:NFACT family protein [Alkalihalobacillus sp. 1P02AB]|uniref:Rqc2 family fibronectin-binding protein n=1 Tax=Alkalihalobacillus sp. 1P02AB TaxID=3132260 RepID=UPI0039A4CCF1
MSFDGMMTRAIVKECSDLLTTGRINKIYQPFKTELILSVRAKGKSYSLLLSANAQFARAHLTNEKYTNPQVPPMFCMLLRKHLEGAFIESITQLGSERIFMIDCQTKDELGDDTSKRLIIEIMGKHSNIILIDRETKQIIDSIKHVSYAQSSYRAVLPGQAYKLPPEQNKFDPIDVDAENLLKRIDFNSGKIDRQIVEQFVGISPMIGQEIISRAGMVNANTLVESFLNIITPIKNHIYEPQMITVGAKEYFSIISLTHLKGEVRRFDTVSLMLDRYFYGKAERDRVRQQAHDLERFLQNEAQKNKKKIKKLEQTLKNADKAHSYQKQGELLTANMHLIKRGDKVVEVMDYYDPNGAVITINLSPQKSPSDNAQAYFKRYNKAKNSVAVVMEQLEHTKKEIEYLEQLIQQMESAAPSDIEEIREELVEEGYIRKRVQKGDKKKKKDHKPQLERYLSTSGLEFFVGKNNKQNDYLTNRFARQDEIWLHTKDIPGSHVVIRSTDPDEQTLKEAATIAAFFSKAKLSSSVPVDFTKIRHVKKPNGSKPGYVIYDNQTTLFVTPDEDLVLQLKQRS